MSAEVWLELLQEQRETNRLLRALLESSGQNSTGLPVPNGTSRTVAEVIDLYVAEQQAKRSWTEKTEVEVCASFGLLKGILADTPLSQFDRAGASGVMAALSQSGMICRRWSSTSTST